MHRHTLQTFRLAPSCVLCTPRPHQRGMLVFTKVCWKWSLHAFSNIPVLWSELFVVVAQWQGFKSAVTSSVSFVYNFSGLSDKEAIPFSTDNPRDSYTWFNKVSSVKAFNLTPVRASGVFFEDWNSYRWSVIGHFSYFLEGNNHLKDSCLWVWY